jgi:hypothetical protein
MGSQAEVIWPDYQSKNGLPPEQVGEGDGEHPPDEPDNAHPGIHTHGFGRALVRHGEPPEFQAVLIIPTEKNHR